MVFGGWVRPRIHPSQGRSTAPRGSEYAHPHWPLRLSNVLSRTAWATVIHMSYEGGDGMKLRDLARGSSNPTSFVPAFHVLRSRFGNRDTSMRSRKTYESVLKFSSLRLLTSLQQTAMVPFLRIFCHPRNPGSYATLPIRTCCGDKSFRPCACHIPTSLHFLIFEQNQRKVYQEILIAGDLSKEDVDRAIPHLKDYAVSRTSMDLVNPF